MSYIQPAVIQPNITKVLYTKPPSLPFHQAALSGQENPVLFGNRDSRRTVRPDWRNDRAYDEDRTRQLKSQPDRPHRQTSDDELLTLSKLKEIVDGYYVGNLSEKEFEQFIWECLNGIIPIAPEVKKKIGDLEGYFEKILPPSTPSYSPQSEPQIVVIHMGKDEPGFLKRLYLAARNIVVISGLAACAFIPSCRSSFSNAVQTLAPIVAGGKLPEVKISTGDGNNENPTAPPASTDSSAPLPPPEDAASEAFTPLGQAPLPEELFNPVFPQKFALDVLQPSSSHSPALKALLYKEDSNRLRHRLDALIPAGATGVYLRENADSPDNELHKLITTILSEQKLLSSTIDPASELLVFVERTSSDSIRLGIAINGEQPQVILMQHFDSLLSEQPTLSIPGSEELSALPGGLDGFGGIPAEGRPNGLDNSETYITQQLATSNLILRLLLASPDHLNVLPPQSSNQNTYPALWHFWASIFEHPFKSKDTI